jgi:hypothetical protein
MKKSQSAEPQDKTATKKKPYRKPSYRSERVFETTALSCGKVAGTQGSCHQNRKVS